MRSHFLPVAVVAALGLTLYAGGPSQIAPKPVQQRLCARRSSEELAPSRDIYCLHLIPVPGLEGVSGLVRLGRIASPFGVNVSADGRHVFDAVISIKGLPDPSTLGEYSAYVAWATTPLLHPMTNLGEVRNGETKLPRFEFNKFVILITAEASAEVEDRAGRLVLRGGSPSTRMRPPDFLEFTLGALSEVDSSGARDTERSDAIAWKRPPLVPGLQMLPALMRLEPRAAPYLPRPSAPVIDARPRELLRLEDGDTLDLEAIFVRRRIRGRSFIMYGFNGQYPGPLIWVRQASTIVVNFTNGIDWPTTVHWHGVRLDNRFDGVPGLTQDPVRPGARFQYRVHFPDAGIYWYHPHHREDVQQDLGLYGNILVRSARPDYFSEANREEVLMLDDLLMGDEGLIAYGKATSTHTMMGRFGNIFLVNGEPEYELSVDRGEVVRFFLTNVASTRTFNLSFGGAPIKIVGSDVGLFEREEWVANVVIAPAERYIVNVRFEEPGTVAILNAVQGIDHLYGRFLAEVDTLGVIHVADRMASPSHAETFVHLRTNSAVVEEIDAYRAHFDRPVDYELVLSLETRELPFVTRQLMQLDSIYFHPIEWSGTMPMMNWATTGKQVRWILREPSTRRENMEIDWRFKVGDVVKIRLLNDRNALHAMQHPMHIHGQRFLILEQNGVPNDNLVWKDTVLLPVGTTADILLELSNPGRWMLHCHIAEHLESGMKMVFTVD